MPSTLLDIANDSQLRLRRRDRRAASWFSQRSRESVVVLAMHIPDGFIDAPTSLGAGVVAVGWRGDVPADDGRRTLDERQVPLAGLVAAFVFAVQMLNFPVATGTSGHLLGGVLAAVLVGPWAGALCVTRRAGRAGAAVRRRRAQRARPQHHQHGAVGAFVGYGVFVAVRTAAAAHAPRRRGRVRASPAFVAPVLARRWRSRSSTPSAATAPRRSPRWPRRWSASTSLIGIGEGVITALTVGAVLATRPDLVYGAREPRGRSAPALDMTRRRV